MEEKKNDNQFTSSKFSEYVMDIHDLYNLALRNEFYLPAESSSAVNEVMLFQVLQGVYWCPKFKDIRMKPCPKPPTKEVLVHKLIEICQLESYNVAWIDEKHLPDKKWLLDVLATLSPSDNIFKKDYVAPPIRKRLQDIETIVLPSDLFEGMPASKSKAKARRLKVMSEAFAKEKTSRLKQLRQDLNKQILDQEVRLDEYKEKLKAKKMESMTTKASKKKDDEKKSLSSP